MHKVENVSREKMWAEGLLCGQSVKYELGNCPIYSHVDKREKCASVCQMGNNIHLQTISSPVENNILGVDPIHYGKVSMGGVTFRISNFASRLEGNMTFTFNFYYRHETL